MATKKRPSSCAWFIVHIGFPLVPFFIEGIMRIIVFDNTVSWSTFSSPTLAMSSGLLCLFVSQSLITHKRIIPSDEEVERMVGISHVFSGLAITSFVFFGAVVLLSAVIEKINPAGMAAIKSGFDIFILIGASIPILFSFYAQRSFKLRTAL